MYDWRGWTAERRVAALADRRERRYPSHSPPHLEGLGRFSGL